MSEEPVLTHRAGRVGRIVLNRPRAINALNHEMVRRVDAALDAWERDPAVETVVITGAGERGLCAGGDIRAVHDDARDGDGGAAAAFWYDEYRLDARIARYPKPYVAVMDGIVMGGGVGISAHGSVRIVTERSRIAMPETGIGFVPDVGGTWLLSRAPGELGTHLGLTGAQIGAADALLCGLADHFVPSDAVPALLDDLAEHAVPDALARHEQPPPQGELAGRRGWIDVCYAADAADAADSADSAEEILRRLLAHGDPAAKEAAETLLTRSPTSLKVTLAALRRARRLDTLEQVLDQEYRVSVATLRTADLVEGIRAQVVDKDRRPRWTPATLSEVTDADVDRFFAPTPDGRELGLAPTP
ncbi:enoyl-CoA hydratase/isomerase family protein [Streptomyces sp. CAI-85]|uniref:enoyl-CoA hydratase/isomerase family protein n=1 Tax=Streptomyces sp. CAI-85 TaxID=1472662 RepID=UPI0015875386|nr:enoyl-CoA hydratase/isomerase family protein [Streptomyces sp. CAI-85]MBO7938534.1 enoyl-CoA hydratase/isomerase family protein [Streptomyces sp. S9]NUV62506.1 enoyl-CoA hydratase/isomerase family protein [Streptomyces sp. CAI-85]